jgi:hypothetical protein
MSLDVACPGLHAEFDDWVQRRLPSAAAPPKTSSNNKINNKNGRGAGQGMSGGDDTNSCDKAHSMAAVATVAAEPPCVGHFTPIRPKEDKDILDRFEHIPCRAGDLVLWDYRIPHANSYRNDTQTAREVVYVGFLPDVPINRAYARIQLERMRAGKVPDDQWHEHGDRQECSYSFSELGRKLMGIDPWD